MNYDECDLEVQRIMGPTIARETCLCKKYGNPYIKKRCPVCNEINTPSNIPVLIRQQNLTAGSGNKLSRYGNETHIPEKKHTGSGPDFSKCYRSRQNTRRKIIKPKVIPAHEFLERYYLPFAQNGPHAPIIHKPSAKHSHAEDSLSDALSNMRVSEQRHKV